MLVGLRVGKGVGVRVTVGVKVGARVGVAVEVAVLPKRRLQLVRVPEARAEAFVGALRERVAR